MGKTLEELQAELKEAKALVAELKAKAKESADENKELKAALKAAEAPKPSGPEYDFVQPNERSPWFVFDGMRSGDGRFYSHEKFVLSQDSGWADYLAVRAKEAVNRAFDPQRVGGHYENLPKFHRKQELHVIVYLADGS